MGQQVSMVMQDMLTRTEDGMTLMVAARATTIVDGLAIVGVEVNRTQQAQVALGGPALNILLTQVRSLTQLTYLDHRGLIKNAQAKERPHQTPVLKLWQQVSMVMQDMLTRTEDGMTLMVAARATTIVDGLAIVGVEVNRTQQAQ